MAISSWAAGGSTELQLSEFSFQPANVFGIDRVNDSGECMRAIALLAICGFAAAYAQSAAPRFDVAVIRPSQASAGSSSGIYTGHGKVRAQNVTLKRCIIGAYGVGPNQVFGGPGWLDSDRFEIDAKIDRDVNDDRVLNEMLQVLMADRFQLALHRETRTLPVYVLEVAKNGPKLDKSGGGESSTNGSTGDHGAVYAFTNATIDHFAQVLARVLTAPVVNRTGLAGAFSFKLEWAPENTKSAGGASIFTAIQEQLGLRLRAEKTPVEVLVIDRAEKPSEN
jgi:uncharacterized protein (TIGR03435 family)